MSALTETIGRPGTAGDIRLLWVGDGDAVDGLPPDALREAADEFEVVVEEEFAGALERVRAGDVDCVVSDHRSSGIDGLSLLEAVRVYRPTLPFFLAPSDGGDAVASRAVDADVTGYVPRDEEGAVERLVDGVREEVAVDDETDRTPILGKSYREESRLKERAMDQAPVGMTIADMNAPDEPLIYVNDAFAEITGYAKKEVLGENCRFLQGEDTDPEKVTRIREAIEKEEPVTVELRNYRKDGTQFWNRLDLYPIADRDGEVSHYAGFQTDVTELRRVQERLEEERENLAELLERVDGLVSDLSDVLVRAETESDVVRLVTQRFGTGPEYDFAWTGEFDPSTETLDPVEWAGDGADRFDPQTVELEADGRGAGAIRRAIEEGSLEVVDDPAAAGPPVAGPGSGVDRCVVVPVGYRDVTYGVVVVYTAGSDTLDDHERAVLSALGRTIGAAINAIRGKRVALTDAGIEAAVELDDPALPFASLTERLGATFEFESILKRPDGGWSMLFAVREADPERVVDLAAETDVVEDVDLLAEHDDDEAVVQFVVGDTQLTRIMTEHGSRLTGMTAEGGRVEVRFETSGEDSARSAMRALREAYDSVSLVEYHESDHLGRAPRGLRETIEERLTDRQFAALRKAYAAGFFEWPRRVEGDVLAESMDIVPSTFHQHLRAAERKLVEEFFES